MIWKSIFREKYNLIFHTTAWSALIVVPAVWLTAFLIGTLGNPFWENSQAVRDRAVAPAEKKVERYLGEWEVPESNTSSHHDNIGREYEPDKWNFCIKCHGPAPHSRTPKERDFLNMHSIFMSCYICHVREQKDVLPKYFGWMDLSSGLLRSNPRVDKSVWGEYGAKIVLLNSGKDPQLVKLEDEEAVAVKLTEDVGKRCDHRKKIRNKFIHRHCVETPVHCIDCHNSEKTFLPYTELGYTAERTAFLVGEEVAGFARYYETFCVSKPLNTESHTPEATSDSAK